MRKLLPVILFFALMANSYGQEKNLTLEFKNILFNDLVDTLEKIVPFKIYYSEKWVDSLTVSVSSQNTPVDELLYRTLTREGFSFFITEDNKVILSKGYSIKTNFRDEYLKYLKKNSLRDDTSRYVTPVVREEVKKVSDDYRIFKIGKASAGGKSETALLSGTVTDILDGGYVKGVIVFVEKLKTGAMTNDAGYYSITLPKGQYQIEYRMIGMKTIRRNVIIYSDGKLDVEMSDQDNLLENVNITANRNNIVRDVRTGIEKINIKMLKQIPMGLGEVDIIKSTLLLPGIQTVGEASGGFNVRGGSADQNLVLLNNAPIINTFHFFGFFSAFNSDLVKDVILYKSGVPAKYGGRLSSVMVISSADGNKEKVRVSGGISPVTGRIMVEGPLFNKKSSFIIGARTTYSDWILSMFKDYRIRKSEAGFHDLQGTFSSEINDKNSISLSGYYSNDKFNYHNESAFNYGNLSSTLKWDHKFNSELSAAFFAIISNYKYQVDNNRDSTTYNTLNYKLDQKILRADFLYKPREKHNIEFGVDATYYSLLPGVREPFGEFSIVYPKKLERERALEPSVYLSDEFEITPLLSISGGLRGTLFMSFGPKTEFLYDENTSRSEDSITDTLEVQKW